MGSVEVNFHRGFEPPKFLISRNQSCLRVTGQPPRVRLWGTVTGLSSQGWHFSALSLHPSLRPWWAYWGGCGNCAPTGVAAVRSDHMQKPQSVPLCVCITNCHCHPPRIPEIAFSTSLCLLAVTLTPETPPKLISPKFLLLRNRVCVILVISRIKIQSAIKKPTNQWAHEVSTGEPQNTQAHTLTPPLTYTQAHTLTPPLTYTQAQRVFSTEAKCCFTSKC